jgi:two-component system phosphate regulon sensor histidine kinase PhoR
VKLGLRGRLVTASIVVLAAVGLTSGQWLEARLEAELETRIESDLVRFSQVAVHHMTAAPTPAGIERIDPVVDALGEIMGVRVTFIAPNGRVLGDSDLTVAEVMVVENHADRPEIIAAHAVGQGVSRRYSDTIKRELMYVARTVPGVDQTAVVRVALPLEEIGRAQAELRRVLLWAGLIALVVALGMSWLAAHLFGRTLQRIVARSRELVGPDGIQGDELWDIASSMERMAQEIERLVETLANERGRFSAVLESMDAAVIAIDGDRRVSLVNGSARKLLQLQDPLSQPVLSILDVPGFQDLLEGILPVAELVLPGPPEHTVLARATAQGTSGGLVLVLQDITEVKRLEQVRQTFVANVSHELRTPLSVIQANAETLLDGALDDREVAETFLSAMLRHSERLGSLVSDLLDLSRIEAGQQEFDLRPVPLRAVLRRIMVTTAPRAQGRGIEVHCRVPDTNSVVADVSALEQVLLNLVDNAVKYGRDGGNVWVSSSSADGGLKIEISDDGPGIDPVHHSHLFERFYRVDVGRPRAVGGTGLGLAIVKHLVTGMGGDVGVDVRLGGGTVFWVELPQSD